MKHLAISLLTGILAFSLCACGVNKNSDTASETAKITIAYQYGLAYAPFTIMQEQSLIEKNFDGDLEVEWVNLNSGSAINEGVASGNIDVAAMGIGPFITGAAAGIPYKMYGTISAQPHKIMSNNANIKSLADITAEDKIALVNIGSFQHIVLAMLAEKELGDAHALDNNIAAMSHPDGMQALLAGSAVCQLTTSPYIYQEEQAGMYEVEGLESVWPEGNAFIVGLISEDCYKNQPKVYEAVVHATQEAMDYIHSNPEESAQTLAEKQDANTDDVLDWMNDPACVYDMKLPGVMDFAEFMENNGFLDKAPASFESISTEDAR